jgi:hypothetical protein
VLSVGLLEMGKVEGAPQNPALYAILESQQLALCASWSVFRLDLPVLSQSVPTGIPRGASPSAMMGPIVPVELIPSVMVDR